MEKMLYDFIRIVGKMCCICHSFVGNASMNMYITIYILFFFLENGM